MFLSYQLHKVWKTDLIFDLDLWPTNPDIDRNHLLTKDYLLSKLEVCGAKQLHKVKEYRHKYLPTDQHLQSNMPLLLWRGHKYEVSISYGSKVTAKV